MQPYTLLLGLGALTSALPTATTTTDDAVAAAHQNPTRTLSTRGTIAETVAAIMPLSTSCASRGDECVTAAVAAPYFVSGMNHYGVATAVEQAGILALVAYESGQLQYKVNTNAANAAGGQGTSNEQSGAFNLEFANTFPELAALGLTTGTVLDHVTDNKYNFWTVRLGGSLGGSSLDWADEIYYSRDLGFIPRRTGAPRRGTWLRAGVPLGNVCPSSDPSRTNSC